MLILFVFLCFMDYGFEVHVDNDDGKLEESGVDRSSSALFSPKQISNPVLYKLVQEVVKNLRSSSSLKDLFSSFKFNGMLKCKSDRLFLEVQR
ncbi:uncharacterized protein LOC123905081 isoform X2 [Trifolium pratense]|nr:uncharacterized protein LOC123905081 isoform X2 [Trifolium pratense]